MIFTKTKILGVYIIEPEKFEDERGFFSRTFDSSSFNDLNLVYDFIQHSMSYNKKKGTIRGLHYQINPFSETKIVSCSQGKIYDVLVDLRPNSSTYLQWDAFELTSNNFLNLYIPEGIAHGFQTLENDTIVNYQISQIFKPEFAKGIRWNDNTFKISWPMEPIVISKKDLSYADFTN